MPEINGDLVVRGTVAALDRWTFTKTVDDGASAVVIPVPTGLRHLMGQWSARTTETGASFTTMNMTWNGDTGANYINTYSIHSDDGTLTNANNNAASALTIPCVATADSEASSVGVGYMIFSGLDASIRANAKGGATLIYDRAGAAGSQSLGGQYFGNWATINAITSITFTASSGNFVNGTTFSLWGH